VKLFWQDRRKVHKYCGFARKKNFAATRIRRPKSLIGGKFHTIPTRFSHREWSKTLLKRSASAAHRMGLPDRARSQSLNDIPGTIIANAAIVPAGGVTSNTVPPP
jgi:hypothetical protein